MVRSGAIPTGTTRGMSSTHGSEAFLRRCAALLACALLAGCHATEREDEVRTSGFLYDYSRLEPGGEGEAQLVYINPEADFTAYDAIQFEPVEVWMLPSDSPVAIDATEMQRLADALDLAMRTRLGEDYRLVDAPGPRVMRLRVALTEASESSVPLDMASLIIPIGAITTWGSKLATGTHSFVGRAGVEAEFSDSLNGKILAAGVDRRVGGKEFGGSTDSWNDVYSAFELWADRLINKLRALRSAPEDKP
jgi:hypothetical protein